MDNKQKWHKLTEQEIKQIVNKFLGANWKIIKIGINRSTYVNLIDSEGYFYNKVLVNNIKKHYIPKKFHPTNPYTIQNIKLWCKLNNKPFELLSKVYENAHQKLQWRCLKCNNLFLKSLNVIQRDSSQCPFCGDNLPYGEKFFRNLLKQLFVEYIPQFKSKWTKNFRYDFFLNNKIIVEVHGQQHYKISQFHKLQAKKNGTSPKQEFHYQQVRDRYKRMYVKSKGYHYLEIPYWTDDENETWKKMINNKIKEIKMNKVG